MKTWEEMSRKEKLESEFWDAYKDAHGFRPRHVNVAAMTEQQLEDAIANLIVIMEANDKQRAIEQADAADRFETLLTNTIAMGAGDRETAIRWLLEANNCGNDLEFLCYKMDLPYGYFSRTACEQHNAHGACSACAL